MLLQPYLSPYTVPGETMEACVLLSWRGEVAAYPIRSLGKSSFILAEALNLLPQFSVLECFSIRMIFSSLNFELQHCPH